MDNLLRRPNDRTDAFPARRRAACAKPLVLVVEDHDDTRLMLKYLLERRGCRVALAADGETAFHVAEQTLPDLILMNAGLPRVDGLEATRRIRKTSALACVPVVFLSGHAEAPFRAAALETGGNDYLIKPFEVEQLERVLERHLGGPF
ncbi:MAG TPA: response regulator [Pyrinomonadaceae bacterium]|jgi:CheY-like chemotaxis protein|nr:response regulator [Pyrinomonadaceae bacterium]